MAVKRTISHHDLDGNPVSEDWYFSLGKSDVLEMDVVHDYEDVPAYLGSILKDAKNHSREIVDLWKQMLFHSVGQRQGNLLVKDEDVVKKFRFSGAYEQFLGELLDEDDAGASFFMAIMPKDIQDRVASESSKTYSPDEMMAMTDDEFAKAFGTDDTAWDRDVLLVAMRRRNHSGSKAA